MTTDKDEWFGLHERLATPALRATLQRLGLSELADFEKGLARDEMPAAVAAHLGRHLGALLLELRERDQVQWAATLSTLRDALQGSGPLLAGLVDELPEHPFQQLWEVRRPHSAVVKETRKPRPDIPLAVSALLTGSRHSPSLVSQIEKELASADRAEWLVSFIKFSGLRALLPALRQFTDSPGKDGKPRLRIATTTYLGATDIKAIETLLSLPHTELRASYDTHRTRLHAKAYLFHRSTGFGSAYVGSANVSRVALDEGLEWTARISQHELPHVWRQVVAGFDMHWEDQGEFEPLRASDLERFREALNSERKGPDTARASWHCYELRPHGFQQEILEAITAERRAGRHRHLVIAATGTGKTMLAGFDYARVVAECSGQRPSLLFLAHREEILKQALDSFRQLMRDADFGDLLVAGMRPEQSRHLFCSVQSWHARGLQALPPGHFEYVVLDEAHHAAADSYQAILEHLQPRWLLGLTATPERADGRDIREDFGGSYSHELRLPDAIEARHLVPFHYFGIGDDDSVDFSALAWQRGGYRSEDLERIIGHNERRARWVLNNLIEHVAEVGQIRCLGFCVSQKHAAYMADYFNAKGLPAMALTAASSREQRLCAQRELLERRINVIFTVDLYNEGVDIPAVDTVLLLRPTESLTVYLQQLGRGLRLYQGKAQLTVLDFIAPQHRQFRFAERFRAMSTRGDLRVDRQIDAGFPWLPAGCLIRLDRKASQTILDNIRNVLDRRSQQVISELRALRQQLGREPDLQEMLQWLHLDDVDLLLKHGMPCSLLARAGGPRHAAVERFSAGLGRGLRQLATLDDELLLDALAHLLRDSGPARSAEWQQRVTLGLSLLWGKERPGDGSEQAAISFMREQAGLRGDLLQVIAYRRAQLLPGSGRLFPQHAGVLQLHASYTREQVLLALGRGEFARPVSMREGVLHLPERRVDLFFVTIDKTEKDFSPSTQYEDYALSATLFHWQSQSATSAGSATGKRYVNHQREGYTPLLFARQGKQLANGLTQPFRFLGPVEHVRHEGDRPMSIVWRLRHPLPAALLRECQRKAV